MSNLIPRRQFIRSALAVSAMAALPSQFALANLPERLFRISLAQWSLHRQFFSGQMDVLKFPQIARDIFELDAVEYVNQFYSDKFSANLVKQLKHQSQQEGVRNLLIMVDREGALGDPDATKRHQAVKNHLKWADMAAELGCHSIRVNAASEGNWQQQKMAVADGLFQLAEHCTERHLNVIVENHGGLSSNGVWLSEVMQQVNRKNVGTLPDFGNFTLNKQTGERYDQYLGVKQLLPFAKAVSAKAYQIDEFGKEPDIDFYRMMRMVLQSGYRGYVGIEYEGDDWPEIEGIKQTQALLERVHRQLLNEFSAS